MCICVSLELLIHKTIGNKETIPLTRWCPVQARVAASEFKEFPQNQYLFQIIAKIMFKRMSLSCCVNKQMLNISRKLEFS